MALAFGLTVPGAIAQGGGAMPTQPNQPPRHQQVEPTWPAPPTPSWASQARGPIQTAQVIAPQGPPPDWSKVTIPPDVQQRIADAKARGVVFGDKPHNPQHRAQMRVDHKPGTPPPPGPRPTGEQQSPSAEDTDPSSSLRLLSAEAQINGSGGTSCFIYSSAGGAFDGYNSFFWGEGYQDCDSPYWIYLSQEQLIGYECYFVWLGYCFPGTNTYLGQMGSSGFCQNRFPYGGEPLWCSGTKYPNQPGAYYVSNNGTVVATDGSAGATVDSYIVQLR
jgi:hypothetical protein